MSSFCKCKSYSHFFSKNISIYTIINDQSFNSKLTNDNVSFEQLGPDEHFVKCSAECMALQGIVSQVLWVGMHTQNPVQTTLVHKMVYIFAVHIQFCEDFLMYVKI